MSTPMTPAQAAQNRNRTGGGQYKEKAYSEAALDLGGAQRTPEQAGHDEALNTALGVCRQLHYQHELDPASAAAFGLELDEEVPGHTRFYVGRVKVEDTQAVNEHYDDFATTLCSPEGEPLARIASARRKEVMLTPTGAAAGVREEDATAIATRMLSNDDTYARARFQHDRSHGDRASHAHERMRKQIGKDLGRVEKEIGHGTGLETAANLHRFDYDLQAGTMTWKDHHGHRVTMTTGEANLPVYEVTDLDTGEPVEVRTKMFTTDTKQELPVAYLGESEPRPDPFLGGVQGGLAQTFPWDGLTRGHPRGITRALRVIEDLENHHLLREVGGPDVSEGKYLLEGDPATGRWDYDGAAALGEEKHRPRYRTFTEDDGTPVGPANTHQPTSRDAMTAALGIQDRDTAREFAQFWHERTLALNEPKPDPRASRQALEKTPLAQPLEQMRQAGVSATKIEPVQVGSKRYWSVQLEAQDASGAFALGSKQAEFSQQVAALAGTAPQMEAGSREEEREDPNRWGETYTVEVPVVRALLPASGMGRAASNRWSQARAAQELRAAQEKAREMTGYGAADAPELDRFRSSEAMQQMLERRKWDKG